MSNKEVTKQKGAYYNSHITVVDKLWPDVSKDPYFVEKLEWAKAFVRKCKFPKEVEDRTRLHVTSKEFSLAPFKIWW